MTPGGGSGHGRSLALYAAAGVAATAAHYALLALLVETGTLGPAPAAVAGAALGAGVAYALNRRLAFAGTTAPHGRALPRFLATAALGAACSGACVWAGTALAGLHYLLAQVGATLLAMVLTYGVNRRWTFGASPP
jgi:putative flippase GtrA